MYANMADFQNVTAGMTYDNHWPLKGSEKCRVLLQYWARSESCEKRPFTSSLTVRLFAWNNLAPTGRIFVKFYTGDFQLYITKRIKFG
jgi:hypothetical protein